jgi:hypothetical protein
MIGIPVALLAFNAGEWATHKYVLHALGKRKKDSFFRFHFFEHHQATRKHAGYDPNYQRSVFGWHAQGREALALAVVGVAHAPLFPVAPFYTATIWYSLLEYHRVHKRSHLDPDWARTHVPWHYDHHMGPDQEKNWGVTHPWMDVLMGTRVPYVGTPKEREDRERRAAKAAREAAKTAEPAPARVPAAS